MILREAVIKDIAQIQIVRNLVKENILSDPALVKDSDVEDYIIRRGKGWVYEERGTIIGFSIVSVIDNNVWALFIHPDYEKRGLGKKLHHKMMNWYFANSSATCWLSTTSGTRADYFYRQIGWVETGIYGKDEIKFEMTSARWKVVIEKNEVN